MITLVIGGSGSGKSAYAEDRLLAVSGVEHKFYIATMQVYGEEGKSRVKRHRKLRAGKGFLTVEQPSRLTAAATKLTGGKNAGMLECVSNLLANEMFGMEENILETQQDISKEKEIVALNSLDEKPLDERIVEDILFLTAHFTDFIIVSNNVFEDGIQYDETTMEYLRILGSINKKLADAADEVVEVVVGIPVYKKSYAPSCRQDFHIL